MAHKRARFLLVAPSTIKFIREARKTKNYSWIDWLHGTVYGRWPHLYIGIGIGEHPLAKKYKPVVVRLVNRFKPRNGNAKDSSECTSESADRITFADTYHGKVVPLKAAQQLVLVNQEVRLTDLETIIPYQRARDIILKNPDHIVALDCPCRSARSNPCLPLDVCLVVGEPFASYVQEHIPKRSRWISPTEAVAILEAEDQRGHVHHAFFKDAMLGRFYAICNCCSCCCGAMQAQRGGTPMLASSGYIAQLDPQDCIGCGTCEENCQFHAIHLVDYTAQIDHSNCMGCGVCVNHCDQQALSLVRDATKGAPLEILSLLDAAR